MKRLLHPLSPATGATQFDNAFENYVDPTFSATVIAWQKQHGRHALPWQNTRDAYLIWLSEIMLQQTQVTAVLGYYARFLERFPTLRDLAEAPVEDVMAQWSGLGYYTRARNLHKCAQRVVAEYDGVFPSDPALLADLPGIGRSTAAASSSLRPPLKSGLSAHCSRKRAYTGLRRHQSSKPCTPAQVSPPSQRLATSSRKSLFTRSQARARMALRESKR